VPQQICPDSAETNALFPLTQVGSTAVGRECTQWP